MYRKMFYMGVGAYAVMLLLSIIYFKERIIFLDTAFNLFHLVRTNAFCITHSRFGDLITQIPPLIARRSGASLHVIMCSYSAAFTLYYLVCYLVCGAVLKQYRFALMVLLLNTLMVAHTFYWPVSQVPQGMALWMVVLAMLARSSSSPGPLKPIVILLCVVTLAFFHPLMVLVIGYSTVFFYRQTETAVPVKSLWKIAGLFILTLVAKAIFFRAPYEQHAMGGLKNFIRLFPNYFSTYSNTMFLVNCLTNYYWLVILLGVAAIHYATRRNKRQLVLLVGSFFGYLMLVNICYPSKETPAFYIENLYLPLGYFVLLSFVFDVLPGWDGKRTAVPIVALILLTGCWRMYFMHSLYTDRYRYARRLMHTYEDKKVVVGSEKVNSGMLQMIWGTPYEFWLLSQSEQGRTASIIIDDDPKRRGWAASLPESFVVNWNVFAYKELPQQYFNFRDTTSGYIIDP